MVPTLKDGNIMILDKIGYRINGVKRFDIVVVHYNGGNIIKRDNVFYINIIFYSIYFLIIGIDKLISEHYNITNI